MKCPQCQADNIDTAEFCGNCGAKLDKACPQCGTSNPAQYAFCGECGYDLRSVPIPAPSAAEPTPEVPEPAPTVAAEPILETPEPAPMVTGQIKVHRRIPTGIEGLDQLIGGGFIANKVYLISGESGTGKTVFGLQYLYYGLIVGENGIYVSGDEKPSHLIVDAESLGWDFSKYAHEQKLGLLDVSPHFTELRSGKTKYVDVRTVVADLAKHAKTIDAKRIVIDPIGPLVFGQECAACVQEYIRNLIFAIEDNLQCTVLITSGIPSGTSALSRYGVAEFVAEGVIVLGMSKSDSECTRTLFIRKMRSTPTDLCEHVFDILPHRGIVIKE
ncbi:MAG: zinc-ribbon domain-containing protein [Chloroflexi bacterium]|nr:zinc-ribbon domain-containing protein [Chloroflexota bacterium]